MLSWKRDRGPLEGGRLETPGLEGWGQGHPTPWASSGQKSAPAVPLRLVLLDWVRPCQETSKAAVAGSLPKSSGRRTSQPGGKTGQTCASLSALAALLLTGWQTHCSPGRPAAGRPPPPPFLQPAGRASQPATLHSREAPAWSLALPELWTTPARTVSVGGMNEAGCRCRKALYLLPCGEVLEPSRGTGKQQECGREWGAREAGGPGSSRGSGNTAQACGTCPLPPTWRGKTDNWMVFGSSHYLVCHTAGNRWPHQGGGICGVSSRQKLFRVGLVLSLRVGKEGTWANEIN